MITSTLRFYGSTVFTYWLKKTMLVKRTQYLYSLEFRFSSLACVLPTNKPNQVMNTSICDGDHCHRMHFLLSHLHWEVDIYLFRSRCANVTLKGKNMFVWISIRENQGKTSCFSFWGSSSVCHNLFLLFREVVWCSFDQITQNQQTFRELRKNSQWKEKSYTKEALN